MKVRLVVSLLVILALAALLLAGCGAGSSVGTEAALPSLDAPSQGQGGLHGPPAGWTAKPPIHVRPAAVTAPTGYTPAQMRHAYGFDTLSSNGTGQTIAIVNAYGSPTIQKDLNVFCAKFGIPTTTIQIAYPSGRPRVKNAGWALETALDVEWAHAMAPGAKILLVISPDASFAKLLAAVDYAAANAQQVSMSWGGNEWAGETSYDFHFNKSGVAFTAASGDSGGEACWPAASPYVTAVGGTNLVLNATGDVLAETAWSGSNGGPSAYEPAPTYQSAWQSTAKRQIPDVSYNGDPATGVPVYSSTKFQGRAGWFQVGGTSAGAPQWAALLAITNASRSAGLSSCNAALYGLGSPSDFLTYYRDITSGSNLGYTAVSGYDMVTGVGTPLASALVPGLAAW